MTTKLLATMVAALFAAGAYAQADSKPQASGGQAEQTQKQSSKEQSKDKQAGAPAVVLVPLVVTAAPDFGKGCWVQLYDGENFQGDRLTVVGPADMPNMRTAFGTDWSGSFDSVHVGPRATVTVYDNENYQQKVQTFKANQRVADLGETRGFFEDIRSLRIACAGGKEQKSQQAQPSKQSKQERQ